MQECNLTLQCLVGAASSAFPGAAQQAVKCTKQVQGSAQADGICLIQAQMHSGAQAASQAQHSKAAQPRPCRHAGRHRAMQLHGRLQDGSQGVEVVQAQGHIQRDALAHAVPVHHVRAAPEGGVHVPPIHQLRHNGQAVRLQAGPVELYDVAVAQGVQRLDLRSRPRSGLIVPSKPQLHMPSAGPRWLVSQRPGSPVKPHSVRWYSECSAGPAQLQMLTAG